MRSLQKVRAATGLAVDTIRKYIALAEDLNNIGKISSKDRYYNYNNIDKDKDNALPPDIADYNNRVNVCQEENKKNLETSIREEIEEIKSSEDGMDVFTSNEDIPTMRDVKKSLIIKKLSEVSEKYINVLAAADEAKIKRTSLKDIAIITGVLIDKQVQLEHKNADVVKNQSIIFNLFGDNGKLAEFISGSMARQKALRERPVKKYIPATNR